MQTSLHVQSPSGDACPDRHVLSLLGFGMMMAALCCATSVLGNSGSGGAPASTVSAATRPHVADSCDASADLLPGPFMRRGWREERSAAMMERIAKCEAVSAESSPPSCFSERL